MVNCAICLETGVLPCCCVPCGHIFCRGCIVKWREKSLECPDCRTKTEIIQPLYGLPEHEDQVAGNDSSNGRAKSQRVDQPGSAKTRAIYLRYKWILFIIFILTVNIFIMIDLYIGSGNIWYLLNLPFELPMVLISVVQTIIFGLFDLVIKILLFPLQPLLNLTNILETLSSSVEELFWIVLYALIFCFIVWHCISTYRHHVIH